jgi:Zn-dependent protease
VYVGRPFGIPVYFDLTWILLAVYITYSFAPNFTASGSDPNARSYSLSFLVALFFAVSVLAHELSHSGIARLMDMPVTRVTILFFGGISEIASEPETPARSYLVSVAGPLMSLLLASGASLVLVVAHLGETAHYLVALFAGLNGIVAILNLLPGLPLDGGHVLRAAVWQVTGSPNRGTRAAAYAGRAIGVAVIIGGLVLANLDTTHRFGIIDLFMAGLLGLYLWNGASNELRQAQLRTLLPTIDLRLLLRKAIAVTADTPLAEAVRRAHLLGARALVVVDHDGRPQALVPEQDVIATPVQRQPWVNVGSMGRALEPGLVLDVRLTGEPLLATLQTHRASEYLVVEPDGWVLGVLVASDLVRVLRPG